jgi:hypothetical protein
MSNTSSKTNNNDSTNELDVDTSIGEAPVVLPAATGEIIEETRQEAVSEKNYADQANIPSSGSNSLFFRCIILVICIPIFQKIEAGERIPLTTKTKT